ncbi:hypothetical protein [Euzebya sp.]|uniref:hypothetical protein n=1 Tax=Euzebya sp. TaxID=1971409 RepID=UPI0035156598
MSQLPPGRGRRLADVVDERPLQGGLTGIALVALATLGLAVVGAVLVGLALLLVG